VTDDADRSDAKIEAAIEEGIRKARQGQALRWTGECHFCGCEVSNPANFCDTDCRDDYEAEQRAKRLRGG